MKFFKAKISWKLLAIIILSAATQIYSDGKSKYEEGKVYRHQLKNGLTVLTIERHIAPLIYHQLTYKVGSRNEKLGITGISHIVEHLMFKGTKRYGKGEVSKTISDNSGVFNAFTMNDMTSYFEYFPANKIEIAMDIESDRMQNSIFNPDEFKSEVEVIKQERRMRTESVANGILNEQLNAIAYSSSPNRDPVIGWPGDLSHVTRDDAYNYYKTFYTPNNAFLVLVGDFKTDDIMKLVEKYYGNIPAGPKVPEVWSVEEPQKVKKTFTLYHADFTSPSVKFAFHIPSYNDSDAAALRIINIIFSEKSRDSRLYKRLVETDRIAQVAMGGFGITKDPTLYQLSINVKPDSSVERAEQIFWDEIQKMQTEPVSDTELQKAKNRFKFDQSTAYTKNTDIGSLVNTYEAYFGWDYNKEFFNRVLGVSKEDIMRVMKKYFNQTQVTIAYSFPKEGSKKVKKISAGAEGNSEEPTEQLRNADNTFYYQPPMEALEITNNVLKNNEEPIKPNPIAPLIKTLKLDNGITLQTIENHLSPQISVVGLIETGIVTETLEGQKPGITGLLSSVMNRATEKLDYEHLSGRMAFVPFSFSVGGGYKSFSFEGNSLTENADEMMSTGFDLVTKPALNEKDIEKVRPNLIINAKDRLKKTTMKAFYHMFDELFAGHPITKIYSTEKSLKSITREDLVALHDKYFRPDRLTLLMVGDMTPEQMRDLANKYFGKWKVDTKAPEIITNPPVKEFTKKEIKVFPEKDYAQCTINVGFTPYSHIDPAEDAAVEVLNEIIAGSVLTSRMGIELRDKQGLIYGIKSDYWVKSDSMGYWKFETKTAPKNTEKVLVSMFKEFRKLFDGGVTDTELATAKKRLLGMLPFYVETPDDVASKVFDMMNNKQPFDFCDKKADRILAVTKDDVLRAAKKYFTIDKYVIVVDGPIDEHSLDGLTDKL